MFSLASLTYIIETLLKKVTEKNDLFFVPDDDTHTHITIEPLAACCYYYVIQKKNSFFSSIIFTIFFLSAAAAAVSGRERAFEFKHSATTSRFYRITCLKE